jgi:hypothetical protein
MTFTSYFMKLAFIVICGLLVPSFLQIDTNSRGWRGIVPFHSTRADVERLLGLGINECKCSYYMKDENVFFHYSSGDCKSGRGVWNVPADTVIGITVHAHPSRLLSDLKLDGSKFEKRQDGHIKALVQYVNDEDGLLIEVDEDIGAVMGFYYRAASKDKHLRCPK